jgi:hypothetical protein
MLCGVLRTYLAVVLARCAAARSTLHPPPTSHKSDSLSRPSSDLLSAQSSCRSIGGVGDHGSGPDPVSVCADWKTRAGGGGRPAPVTNCTAAELQCGLR